MAGSSRVEKHYKSGNAENTKKHKEDKDSLEKVKNKSKRRSFSPEDKKHTEKKHVTKNYKNQEPQVSSEDDISKIKKAVEKESLLRKRLKQKYFEREQEKQTEHAPHMKYKKVCKSSDDRTNPTYDRTYKEHTHRKHEHESRSDRDQSGYNKQSHKHNIDNRLELRDDRREISRDHLQESRSVTREWDYGKKGTSKTDQSNWDNQQQPASDDFGSASKKDDTTVKKEEPNFKLSGKLTEYTNTYNGVVIMYNEPVEARKPKTRWRFYPFKGEEALPMLALHRQSAFLLGRDRKVADIPVDHPSCSKQHAVLQFRLVDYERPDGASGRKVKPYIIDLESTNGTYVNNKRVDPRRYVELIEKDVLKFGFSSREYVMLHEKSEDAVPSEEEGDSDAEEKSADNETK